MMTNILNLLFILMFVSVPLHGVRPPLRYWYFEDYLTHLDLEKQGWINGESVKSEVGAKTDMKISNLTTAATSIVQTNRSIIDARVTADPLNLLVAITSSNHSNQSDVDHEITMTSDLTTSDYSNQSNVDSEITKTSDLTTSDYSNQSNVDSEITRTSNLTTSGYSNQSDADFEITTTYSKHNIQSEIVDEIATDVPNTTTRGSSNTDLLSLTGTKKDKEVTCCMLGQLAGDKGFHCFVKFYVARILMRNYNRAHNRKMAFHGAEKVPNYGVKTMRTFEQCVAGHGAIFHKCCHLAAAERRRYRYDSEHGSGAHLHHSSERHFDRKTENAV
ncbi:uncharacterized protein LOC106469718 isoform X2 [Limulus polyphemus]|uniref:Uncharacterized protein LOC106469718 isoform X2 n=1 Tax=Limulus polyphemus TaxID=6850 RepID=A0ABM1BNQ1_LIMPO|nr:uncharacterized protein LOC106469718 isoform X2 [Limulus polyphemus]